MNNAGVTRDGKDGEWEGRGSELGNRERAHWLSVDVGVLTIHCVMRNTFRRGDPHSRGQNHADRPDAWHVPDERRCCVQAHGKKVHTATMRAGR